MPWNFSDMYGRQKVVDANIFPITVPIYDTTLTGTQTTIDIASIPQNYVNLNIRMLARGVTAGTNDTIRWQANGDAGSNYDMQALSGNGATASAFEENGVTGARFGDVAAATSAANYAGLITGDIYNYAGTTFYKNSNSLAYLKNGAVGAGTAFCRPFCAVWKSTAAITSLRFLTASGAGFAAGTRLTIWGDGVVAPASPGSVLPVQYGTSLPASPLDGQEAILVDNTSTPTYSWRFRYNGLSANTDKWEFVGGAPLIVSVATSETTASGSPTDLATVGPAFTAPRAGIYVASVNADGANNTGGGDTFLDFKAGTNGAVTVVRMNRNSTANVGGGGGGWVQGARVNASDVLKMQYHVATGTGTFEQRTMAIQPLRVS